MATPVTNTLSLSLNTQVSGDAKAITVNKAVLTGNNTEAVAVVVPTGTTDMLVDHLVIPHTGSTGVGVAGLVLLAMASSQKVHVKTNNATTPGDFWDLDATAGYQWCTGHPANPIITADVTKLYLTNTSGTDARFDLRALYN